MKREHDKLNFEPAGDPIQIRADLAGYKAPRERATRKGRFNDPYRGAWDRFVRSWFLILWALSIALVITLYLIFTV